MLSRMMSGWNTQRTLQAILGLGLALYAIANQIWFGAFLGAYLILMGVFGLGCGAGNCNTSPASDPTKLKNIASKEVTFEEVEEK